MALTWHAHKEHRDAMEQVLRKALAKARRLRAFDDEGQLWLIEVVHRDTDGTPAATVYRCSVVRDFGDARFSFLDEFDEPILTMRSSDGAYLSGNAGDTLELKYEGVFEWTSG